jgi:four helix bundle protein
VLSFQGLDVYRVTIQFLALALEVVRKLPRGHADDADQLRRSAKSVARNIAEGAGRSSNADKAKHYAIARGEAMECACSFDIMQVEGTITRDQHARGIAYLERIVAMLTRIIDKPE